MTDRAAGSTPSTRTRHQKHAHVKKKLEPAFALIQKVDACRLALVH